MNDMVDTLDEILIELEHADDKYGEMQEKVEGIHTLKCEIAELEREVMRKNHTIGDMRKEAIQVAAMSIKFLRDCC